jgi:alpha-D-ribose 1-methylphosphonate 5-triphosphate diphosphatase
MIVRNARIVLRDEVIHGCLDVRDGRIAAIAQGNTAAPGSIDFEGDLLLPGLVELHTDNLERNLMPRPKVRWPALPAILAHDAQIAAAGITTVFDALAVGDIDHDSVRADGLEEPVRLINQAAEQGLLRAEHLLHLRCEIAVPNVLDLIRPLLAEPRLRLVSLMDHTPGQRQWTDLDHYRTYVSGKKGWNDEKRERMVTQLLAAQARNADAHRHAITELCRERVLPMATHDDTTEEHVRQAAAEGIAISEFPTTLAAARAARAHGMSVIMGAPNVVRGGSHSGNAAAIDLARQHLLDALSSDYVPASLLHAAFMLVDQAGFTLPDAVATVSANPAAMAALADRGRLAEGMRADFIRVRVVQDGASAHPIVSAVWREGQRVL